MSNGLVLVVVVVVCTRPHVLFENWFFEKLVTVRGKKQLEYRLQFYLTINTAAASTSNAINIGVCGKIQPLQVQATL